MGIKGKLEAIIYAAEEPVTLDQLTMLLKEAVVSEGGIENTEPGAVQAEVKSRIRAALEELAAEYNSGDHGMEVRSVAGGYRMATKPEHHDVVRSFAKSLKPAIRLSLQALETLAVIAYKQPITAPEISEIRGVDSQGVLATLMDRKLITTAGRKQVIGRPILYKSTKEFLMRFGLKDVTELPSMEEFEKLISGQEDLFSVPAPAELAGETNGAAAENSQRASETATEAQPATDEQPSETTQN